jgi:hypothetical protein
LKDINLKRISQLQDSLAKYPELSRSLSIADAVKFTKQAFYSGDPERYDLLRGNEKTFILPYLEAAQDSGGLARGFIDEERRSTRLTVQVADVGTARMDVLMANAACGGGFHLRPGEVRRDPQRHQRGVPGG